MNLRHDLGDLADLIELVFADAMDSSGRSAIREMRYLSHMGYGLNLISRINDLALGISLGFVYQQNGKLVGNVSIYPADYPKGLGEAWILANVAVHPTCQRRGIAGELIDASLEMIHGRGGKRVILQVNVNNEAALRLYESRGFVYERAWQIWRRSGFMCLPASAAAEFHITRLRRDEWRAELDLARAARPNARGGLGWLQPLQLDDFRVPLRKRLMNLLSLNSREKIIIRDAAGETLLASCWIESSVSGGSLRLRLFTAPAIDGAPYAEALLSNVATRHPRSTIHIEHPRDDEFALDLFKRWQFRLQRDLWHMRLDL